MHKNKYILYNSLKYYDELQQIMKEIINYNYNFQNFHMAYQIININEEQNYNNNNNKIINPLEEFDNFLKNTFKRIDLNNELKGFTISLQSLREGIIGRKIRIVFIGNISVGKSTVLNCIIGEDILPINYNECTYRGIIIRHKKGENYKLYKTKIITRGEGLDEYYYFKDDEKPYCEGIKNIKSYLNAKNNDKNIEDKDAYLVITGPLKIFDFIELDKKIISKIEFIDLPGINRKNNTFNDKHYYKKILKFSNCCVYINEPKTINDEDSVNMMINQYAEDKQKIFIQYRPYFIKTCVFLINKVDDLDDDNEKNKIKDNIFKNISIIEEDLKKEDINISFFSGKCFFDYLNIINDYVYLLNHNPKELLLKLYIEYRLNFKYLLYDDFKSFIYDKISKIEENYFLYNLEENGEMEEEEELEPPEKLNNMMKSQMEQLEKDKHKLFKNQDHDEIIKKLYNLSEKLKKKDFSETYYSQQFFSDLKIAIENSEKLYKENLKNNVNNFIKDCDILFTKEIEKDKTEKKTKMKIH